MGMDITLSCAMCDRQKVVKLETDSDSTKGIIVQGNETLREVLETAGWISQNNGSNFDVYCSKKCAQ